ncbi:MAG: hypothetical protein FWH06_07310 [Oscillospiraceae bacterium]|nr:hypothetical protein [Oscillospiraceae bacterium]
MLERLIEWLKGCPGMPGVITADGSEPRADTASLRPKGVAALSRAEDVTGGVTETLRADFILELTFAKHGGDAALRNAEWLIGFQDWVRAESEGGRAPRLGTLGATVFTALGGSASAAPPDRGLCAYTVRLSARYQNRI